MKTFLIIVVVLIIIGAEALFFLKREQAFESDLAQATGTIVQLTATLEATTAALGKITAMSGEAVKKYGWAVDALGREVATKNEAQGLLTSTIEKLRETVEISEEGLALLPVVTAQRDSALALLGKCMGGLRDCTSLLDGR